MFKPNELKQSIFQKIVQKVFLLETRYINNFCEFFDIEKICIPNEV